MQDGWWAQRPFAVAFALLWLVAMLRGQATYWLARGATRGAIRATGSGEDGWRSRMHDWLDGDAQRRGRRVLERWGLPVVPLAYLTVGFQTVVLAAAGALRIDWTRFTLAQVPGAAAWAAIYATIGFAAWRALLGQAASSPVARAVAALAVVAGASWLARRLARRASRRRGSGDGDPVT